MKEILNTNQAPAPIGPYNQAVRVDKMLFISGQVALNPETGLMEQDSLQTETSRVMENLNAILSHAGLNFGDIVKTTIFLTDMAYFAEVNQVYGGYFPDGTWPARETVQVSGLPRAARVEISMIAHYTK
jgi:2-iminobutanoate/2-iminopropanoate deaminase